MSTNDIIIGTVKRGTFKFPIEFDMFGKHQYITQAVFDTGCTHSLISVRDLSLEDRDIEKLKQDMLYDINVVMSIGRGIESKNTNTDDLKTYIISINKKKKEMIQKGYDNERASSILKEHINDKMKMTLERHKNLIRYQYLAHKYTIDGVEIGDCNVNLSFDLKNVNLIGMHIIQKLYTKIFTLDNNIFLLSKKNTPVADVELDVAMNDLRKQFKLSEDLVLEANYVNTQIKNSGNQ